jgi:hypothetical protein
MKQIGYTRNKTTWSQMMEIKNIEICKTKPVAETEVKKLGHVYYVVNTCYLCKGELRFSLATDFLMIGI